MSESLCPELKNFQDCFFKYNHKWLIFI